jgi:acyl-CoA synthetase (AMP-forming)/AMP-acid ligase II/thioesterase domain-containing protein
LTINELVSAAAVACPDAPAVLGLGRPPLAYARLCGFIEDTVRTLNRAGLGRGDRIAVVLPNGPEMATAFVAIASGAVFAPLNPAYGRSEFEYFLADLRAKALVVEDGSDSPAMAVAQAAGIPVIRLRTTAGAEAGMFTLEPANLPNPAAPAELSEADDIALILHTSGTTSRPKIVPLRHFNLCASARNIQRSLALTGADRCLNIMPLFHIHGLAGALLSSLAAGASVVCTPGFYATRFFEWMDEFAPTWYTAVPTMHQAILARAEANREIIERRPLRLIRSCSSALAPRGMASLETAFGAPVIESYGMTEASHQMASNPLPPRQRKPGSVGLAAGPEVAVMDDAGGLAGPGFTGEIVIRGRNVTLGYEGAPEGDQAAFRNGWFRTGDQGHIDSEGYVFLTGRLKELINRGGEKISPREIDEVLLDHPGIAQAVAFSVPHAQLGEEIGAAVVPREGAALTETAVREFAASRLAAFKVPRVVRIVNKIPKGPTGKLQRIGLAEKLGVEPLDDTRTPSSAESIPPRTVLETRLAAIWRDVLALDAIGAKDSFFAFGGDSILASLVVARVSREMNIQYPLLEFLEDPTIAAMAARIEAAGPALSTAGGLVPIQPSGTRLPLFFAASHVGNLVVAGNLARHLDPDQPVWAFPPPALEGGEASFAIEDLAARYLAGMRARQPAGPYLLAGHCFGGFVVFEIARRLREQGSQVALVALLDCFNAQGAPRRSLISRLAWVCRLAARRVRGHLDYLEQHSPEQGITYLMGRVRAFLWAHLVPHGDYTRLRQASARAVASYRPGPYPGPVLLVRIEDRRPDVPLLGWEGLLTGPVEVIDLPFHHFGLSAEPLTEIAGPLLRESLEKAQAALGS